MNAERRRQLEEGLSHLPYVQFPSSGRNGEDLATDEAAVWKRVLNYRIASYLKPRRVLETHPGLGISTILYRKAFPATRFLFREDASGLSPNSVDLIDIDPYGSPWRIIEEIGHLTTPGGVVQVSNGEAHAVRRNLKRGQEFPTQYFGRKLPLWVLREYLPRLEDTLKMNVQYFYAFPTTVRVVLSRRALPQELWAGCPRWMWWLSRYAPGNRPDGVSDVLV